LLKSLTGTLLTYLLELDIFYIKIEINFYIL
jgi:hypothetical protein